MAKINPPKRKPFFTGEWYPWYVDVIRDSERVQRLSLAEEGAYRRALDKQWEKGSLPADPKLFAQQIGKGCTVQIARKVLEFFVEQKKKMGRVANPTLEQVRREQAAIFARSSLRAKKAAATRWGKDTSGDAQAMLKHSSSNAQAMPADTNLKEKKRKEKKRKEIKREEEEASTAKAVSASQKDLAPLDSHSFFFSSNEGEKEGTKFYLKTLSQDPAYMHCNVEEEFKKASKWAESHNVEMSPEFFTGWLDRIFKPITGDPNGTERREIEEIRARVAARDEALRRSHETDS